jgi:hypothetical protein
MTEAGILSARVPTRRRNIAITLLRNDSMEDWSVEINGRLYEHVTIDVVEALVECELIVAETSLAHGHDYGLEARMN